MAKSPKNIISVADYRYDDKSRVHDIHTTIIIFGSRLIAIHPRGIFIAGDLMGFNRLQIFPLVWSGDYILVTTLSDIHPFSTLKTRLRGGREVPDKHLRT